jgi:hypothetical protein
MTKEINYKKLTDADRQYLQDRPWLRQSDDAEPIEAPEEPVVAPEPEESTVEPTEGESTDQDGSEPVVEGSEDDDDVIEEEGDEDGGTDYSHLTVPELKEACRSRDLAVGGTKDELIARLQADDKEA